MIRIVPLFACCALALGLLSADAQDAKAKKKPADTSTLSGRITDVNIDEASKKIESIYARGMLGKRIQQLNIRIDDKTVFEYVGFKNKADEKPRVGDLAEAKIDPKTDCAATVKITAGTGTPKVVPKKKATN